jgi:hypothetical protein
MKLTLNPLFKELVLCLVIFYGIRKFFCRDPQGVSIEENKLEPVRKKPTIIF